MVGLKFGMVTGFSISKDSLEFRTINPDGLTIHTEASRKVSIASI